MSSHLRAIIASLPLLLPATGCIHNSETAGPDQVRPKTRPSPASEAEVSASAVEILGTLPPREDLLPVGEVECSIHDGWSGPSDNARKCRADLRAQARQQGASVVILVTQQVGIFQCAYCVYFYGTAYRRAGAEPKAEAPATTPDAATSP